MKGRRLEKRVKARKGPRYPLDQKKKKKETSWALCPTWTIYECFSSLPNTKKDPKKKKKSHQSLSILLSSPKTRGIVLIPNLLLLGSTLWIWGLGVWV